MSLWYDSKKNEYASDGKNGWIKAFCEKKVGDLKDFCIGHFNEISEKLGKHFSGTDTRHRAEDIDYSDTQTVKDKIDADNTSLKALISAEELSRKNADTALRSDLNTEASTRRSEDNSILTKINSEISARQNAYSTIRNSVYAETSARENGDTALSQRITSEETARQTADTAIGQRVTAVESDLADLKFIHTARIVNCVDGDGGDDSDYNTYLDEGIYTFNFYTEAYDDYVSEYRDTETLFVHQLQECNPTRMIPRMVLQLLYMKSRNLFNVRTVCIDSDDECVFSDWVELTTNANIDKLTARIARLENKLSGVEAPDGSSIMYGSAV